MKNNYYYLHYLYYDYFFFEFSITGRYIQVENKSISGYVCAHMQSTL